MKLSSSGPVISKQATVSQSDVLHSGYSNKYTGAPKLKKSKRPPLVIVKLLQPILNLFLHENNKL